MATVIDAKLIESIEKLEGGLEPNEGLRKLLIDKARNELVKHDLINRNFEEKYGMSFNEFRDSNMMKKPPEDLEQDYFDWEMTVTITTEMRKEMRKLEQRLNE